MADDLTRPRALAGYVADLRRKWERLGVEEVEADIRRPLGVRQPMETSAVVQLAGLPPEAVRVQVYFGPLDAEGRIVHGTPSNMEHREDLGKGRHRYTGRIAAQNSGRHGFAVRVIPGNKNLATPFLPGLIVWDEEPEPVQSAVQPVEAVV